MLVDGMDRFRINHVKFTLQDKSINFSSTFSDLASIGDYAGAEKFLKYIPLWGQRSYNFNVMSKHNTIYTL